MLDESAGGARAPMVHAPDVRRTARALELAVDHPAVVYLATLSTPASRRAMVGALRLIAVAFGVAVHAVPWAEITFARVSLLRTWLGQHYAPSTANLALCGLRGVLRTCVRLGLMTRDAMLGAVDVAPVRGSRVRPGRALEREEIRRLFAAAAARGPRKGARDVALLALIYGGGLRRAEIAALTIASVLPDGVRVRGKGNKERVVPLPASASTVVQRWILVRGTEAGPLFYTWQRNRAQLGSYGLTPSGVHTVLAELAEAANVEHFSPHDCRRTYIGDLLSAGVDVVTVAALVGHASVSTTQRYDRRPERARRDAVAKLDLPIAEPA